MVDKIKTIIIELENGSFEEYEIDTYWTLIYVGTLLDEKYGKDGWLGWKYKI